MGVFIGTPEWETYGSTSASRRGVPRLGGEEERCRTDPVSDRTPVTRKWLAFSEGDALSCTFRQCHGHLSVNFPRRDWEEKGDSLLSQAINRSHKK
ncbi:hypothetical protein EUGRSUZ_J00419 [Eucalyptus grandis]|uniref:Uncharacterized protein n=2 Tax=Eucalyptus grandis TaxID=71139 RepID=A0ACC3J2C1_EUCGR|nr:hypothetical protein EUGRSUZ_J00419 [Eucalyptus grandis]